ncbi:uncharacterized protein LOC126605227 isoform X2 [Malus sylvestris]|uniref:uncharacterized protein LOC126605227 isoform X2 n=1 Tax=Malus sylvestris TaxID=3752 RepID=UPI0021AD1140|nr:uncharacterized protein LOC126605227 isoform X2 [Malus sylvestris]
MLPGNPYGASPYPFPQYSEFSNAYGFVANADAPRPYSNSNNGSRSFRPNNNMNGNGGFRSSQGGNTTNNGSGQSSGNRQNTGSWNSWSGNTDTRSNIVPECQICFKRGHTAPNCWKRSNNASSSGSVVECQICGKKGHSALDCYHKNNLAYQGTAPSPMLTAMQAEAQPNFLPNDSWIVDTRASHHMTADVNALQQVNTYDGQGNQGCDLPRKEP